MTDEPEEAKTLVPDSGPDRDQMAGDYLPESDDWLAKTALDLNDPHAVAALRQLSFLYPELTESDDELQKVIDDFVDDFLTGRTSVGGKSRDEYQNIIMAMFGGNPEDKSTGEKFAELLGAADESDD
jgi:hypothetical protein